MMATETRQRYVRHVALAALLSATALTDFIEAQELDFAADARKYVIQTLPDRTPLVLNEKSLLNWTNPVRQSEKGETFVWLHKQRPYAIATFFTYGYDNKTYLKHEFHSLSPVPLEATFDGKTAWTPKDPGLTWKDVPMAPAPAGNRTGRVLQMRQLARQFRAELNSPKNERTELRLAPRPLYEYSAPDAGVHDGVILSFVVATDPEVLLLMEAYGDNRGGKSATSFRYAFARFHYWDVTAYLGDDKVWQAALDKTHESNSLGNRENMINIYNSFHPLREALGSENTATKAK
jgi:hypothetical protein